MKKKVNILLAGLMLASLASCSLGNTPTSAPSTNPGESTPATPTTPADKPTSPEISTKPTAPSETIVPTIKPPRPERDTYISKDGRVGYQIFVNTFADGNKKNNTSIDTGDLYGIIDNLDYLKENLNVDVLWLTPIHRSPSYNGYDPNDFRSVKKAFGGIGAYKLLLEEAHKRDMFVMLDLVINHTSSQSEWFKQSKLKNPKYRDYYRWTKTKPTENRYKYEDEYYYALFWDQMPDLNYDNPALYNEMLSICKSWIDNGVDGFRIDGAKHVYNYDSFGGMELYEGSNDLVKLNWEKNLEFFNKFNKDIKAYDKNCFITLEVLDYSSDVTSAYLKQGVDSCFDFATKGSIISNINNSNGSQIIKDFDANNKKYKNNNPDGLNSLVLGNHDMNRVLSELGNNKEKAKAAAAIQMLLPGLAWIYNGDELGMSGASNAPEHADLAYRQPYKWGNKYDTALIKVDDATNAYDNYNRGIAPASLQLKRADSMLNFYKDITTLKAKDEVIRNGSFEPVSLNRELAAFKRSLNGKTYLCIVNTSANTITTSYNLGSSTAVYQYKAANTSTAITLEGYGISVIELKKAVAPDCNEIVVHFKGPKGYRVLNESLGNEWLDFKETSGDYQIARINVAGKKLYEIKLSIGKPGEIIYPSTTYQIALEPNSKVFDIFIEYVPEPNEYTYSIDINSSWGFNPSTQKLSIWSWKTDGAPGKWYQATVENNKLSFTLPKDMDNMIIVIFNKNTTPDWTKKIKQTNNLVINKGKLLSSITWQ